MSQVLEKPILLDETGQDISSKINGVGGKIDSSGAAIVDVLEDIKDAIGTSGEFIPLMIKVTTPPTKTTYMVGETLDLTGMVVSLVASNGSMTDVTSACTFVPANGATLTNANTSVAITYHYAVGNLDFSTSQALIIKELDSISVTTPPTKTAYLTGELLDLTGIVVTATYTDGSTANVTTSCAFNPANGTTLSTSDTSVSISYTERGITKTATQVIAVGELSSIAVTTPPTKTSYSMGETLDLTGIVVTASFTNGGTSVVTSDCTFSPANGATLGFSDTSVTVTYTIGGITKTTTQALTIGGAVMYPFETATDAQLAAMLESYYEGYYTAEEEATLKSTYLPVGAKRNINIPNSITPMYGDLNYCSGDYSFTIIDHEHDDLKTQIGSKTKALLTLSQDRILYADLTTQTVSSAFGGAMNKESTNAGGWRDSLRREWCNDNYYNSINSNIKALIKQVVKQSGAGGGSTLINTTDDYVFLLSEKELANTTTKSGVLSGTLYAHFATRANRFKYPYMSNTGKCLYWLRDASVSSYASQGFVNYRLNHSGYDSEEIGVQIANGQGGVSPCFCL